MESHRDALMRELAELEAQLNDMTGFVGFGGGAGAISDDSEQLIQLIKSLKDKIADIKSELEEMDDDA